MTSPEAVAQWMVKQMFARGYLEQAVAVEGIRREFGQKFIRENSIDPLVLAAFRRMISDEDLIWEANDRLWRWRKPGDKPGRRQD